MHTNDDEFVNEELVDEGEVPKDAQKKLREKLKECQAQKQEYLEGWQRAQADAVNAKRLANQREADAYQRGKADVLESLASVLDSFDMAMSAQAWQSVDATWRAGVEGMYAQLLSTMETCGMQVLDPTDQAFNPHEHESVSSEPCSDEALDNTVSRTLQKGMKLGERVVRPAKVIVRMHSSQS